MKKMEKLDLKIDEQTYLTIREGVLAYKAKYVASTGKESGWQGDLAKKANISNVYVSLIANDKREDKTMQAIGKDAWTNLAVFLNLGEKSKEWKAVPTSVYKSVYKICDAAKRNSYAVGIDGEAGIGKTYALKRFMDLEKNVVLIKGSTDLTARGFLAEIAQALGLEIEGKGQRQITERFCQILRQKAVSTAEKPLIIIDEASKLRDSVLYKFITLYNELEGYCGFVLCGCRLASKLIAGRSKGKIGYDEILSRLGGDILKHERCNQKDVEAICQANGVTDTQVVANIWHQSQGHLRQVERLVKHHA